MNETAARAFELNSGSGQIFQKHILIGIAGDFNFSSFKNEVEPFIILCLKGKPRILSIRLSRGHQKEARTKIVEICKEISPTSITVFHSSMKVFKIIIQQKSGYRRVLHYMRQLHLFFQF